MLGPSEEVRFHVGERARELRDLDDDAAEGGLAELLEGLTADMDADIENHPPEEADPRDVASAVAAWTSVVTFAVAEVYAPMSPFPRIKAGFSKQHTLRKLQEIAAHLQHPLEAMRAGLGAQTYSISIGFPFGISIGLDFGP